MTLYGLSNNRGYRRYDDVSDPLERHFGDAPMGIARMLVLNQIATPDKIHLAQAQREAADLTWVAIRHQSSVELADIADTLLGTLGLDVKKLRASEISVKVGVKAVAPINETITSGAFVADAANAILSRVDLRRSINQAHQMQQNLIRITGGGFLLAAAAVAATQLPIMPLPISLPSLWLDWAVAATAATGTMANAGWSHLQKSLFARTLEEETFPMICRSWMYNAEKNGGHILSVERSWQQDATTLKSIKDVANEKPGVVKELIESTIGAPCDYQRGLIINLEPRSPQAPADLNATRLQIRCNPIFPDP